jgi:hypothetical protein
MPTLSDGIPARVWARATQSGIHELCELSGDACPDCETTIMDAFEAVYGGAETMDEVIGMMAYDLARDQVAAGPRG